MKKDVFLGYSYIQPLSSHFYNYVNYENGLPWSTVLCDVIKMHLKAVRPAQIVRDLNEVVVRHQQTNHIPELISIFNTMKHLQLLFIQSHNVNLKQQTIITLYLHMIISKCQYAVIGES